MKTIYISLLLFFATVACAYAGEPYFVTVGHRTLYYERYKAGTKTLVQTTTLDFGEVEAVGQARRTHYGMLLCKANGKPLYGGRVPLSVMIAENGDVDMDFGGTVRMVLKNMFPNTKVTSTGIPALMPANMQPGDTLPDSHCVVKAGLIELTVDISGRKVLRRERITTPAGTFDCMVVRERKVEDGPFHHVDVWGDTWYAPGIGYVRHDEYDKKMQLETSEILLQDTKNQK